MTSYARIRRLTESHRGDIDQTFRKLADHLRDTGKNAILRCTILVPDGRREVIFELQGRECTLSNDAAKVPDLEIITRESTWWEIAEGHLSPLEAFLEGRMRVLGDADLGSHLLRHVAEGEGAVSIWEK